MMKNNWLPNDIKQLLIIDTGLWRLLQFIEIMNWSKLDHHWKPENSGGEGRFVIIWESLVVDGFSYRTLYWIPISTQNRLCRRKQNKVNDWITVSPRKLKGKNVTYWDENSWGSKPQSLSKQILKRSQLFFRCWERLPKRKQRYIAYTKTELHITVNSCQKLIDTAKTIAFPHF